MRATGTMLTLTGCLLAGLFVVAGCRSTSLARDDEAPNTQSLAEPSAPKSAVSWTSARAGFSTATPIEQGDPLRTTSFQAEAEAASEPAPIPDLLPKKEPPRSVHAQPAVFRHGGRFHGGAAMPVAPPNAPNEWSLISLPSYVIRPPDVLLIELLPQFSREEKLKVQPIGLLNQPIYGQHLVRPDGTVGLGVYGPVAVAGRTIEQARVEVAKVVLSRLDPKKTTLEDIVDNLKLDVLTYNSSVYYVITDGAGLGEQVYRFPVTGNETVLDAISNINGLPVVASPKRIWVARRNTGQGSPDATLPVDWKGITQQGAMNTNWQIMPGDRVYVQADPMRRFNNNLGKILEPIERVFGATLLGSQTVNSIRNGTTANFFR